MVFRCFVEKKPGFDGAARALCRELTEQLGVRGLERVRVLNRYDVEGVDAAVYAAAPALYKGKGDEDVCEYRGGKTNNDIQ